MNAQRAVLAVRERARIATCERPAKTLMLVSADAGQRVRMDIAHGRRPWPEYLRLEQRYGVEILDWSRIGAEATGRSPRTSIAHVAQAIRLLHTFDAVFSDGEHVGIPLALAMCARGLRTPHVMIAHNPATGTKRMLLRFGPVRSRITGVLLHSPSQLASVPAALGMSRSKFRLVPYGIDTDFWSPQQATERSLILAPGRDHRDHATLAAATAGIPFEIFVTGASAHSPGARFAQPLAWPANFRAGAVSFVGLRQLYAEAAIVVVPLVAGQSPAGVTTVLEAMAVGKAVVASDTEGLRGVIEDGVTGLRVPPGDASALRAAIVRLAENPEERVRLGRNARLAAEARYNLDVYSDALARELQDVLPQRLAMGGNS
jgi:hypothetical protein